MRTYVVEPQQIFQPSLLELLRESGCAIVRVQERLDPLDVVRTHPELLFFDDEMIDEHTKRSLQFLVDSMPNLRLCIFAHGPLRDLRTNASMHVLHLEKTSRHETLLGALGRFVVTV